ncbi:MAG: hypothetical protein WBP23_03560 [Candidatus Saccharimonadales bacterium]
MKKQSPPRQPIVLILLGSSLTTLGLCMLVIIITNAHPSAYLRILRLVFSLTGICIIFAGVAILRKKQS